MKFMLTFTMRNGAAVNDAIARFKKTGGAVPRGAKLLGRWTRADFAGGFDLIEAEDLKPLTEFSISWADLCDVNVTPVVDDETLVGVLKGMGKF